MCALQWTQDRVTGAQLANAFGQLGRIEAVPVVVQHSPPRRGGHEIDIPPSMHST